MKMVSRLSAYAIRHRAVEGTVTQLMESLSQAREGAPHRRPWFLHPIVVLLTLLVGAVWAVKVLWPQLSLRLTQLLEPLPLEYQVAALATVIALCGVIELFENYMIQRSRHWRRS